MILPENFTQRMINMLEGEYDAFISALENEPIRAGIRINTLKENAQNAVLAEFGELEPVQWCKTGYFADKSELSGNHPYHAAGLLYFQEPSAMSVVEGLPVDEGDFVLDLCAAPGGKSTQAAAKLNGTGLLVSNEIVRKRAEILSGNIERMGIKNAVVTNESPEKLAKKYPSFFDKIIIDAPCSGEGMFRKEPQAVTEWSVEHTNSCAARQKNIIDSAVKMLRGGGYIIYSTCTFAPVENEQVVSYILDNYNFELCEIPELAMLSNGVPEWSDGNAELTKTKRIFPHREKGEGHFIALLKNLDDTPSIRPLIKPQKVDLKFYREFEKSALNFELQGNFTLFGDNLYLVPDGIDIDGIKVIRAGLHLGVMKKNRFEPSHAMAMAFPKKYFKNIAEYGIDDANKYLCGEVLSCSEKGWCAVAYNGFVLGWGKADGSVIKNHYPKGLRIRK